MPTMLSAGDASGSLAPGLRTTHYICGCLALVVAVGTWFLLRPSPLARMQVRRPSAEQTAPSFYVQAREGLLEGRRNWRIGLAYAGGLVARGDSVVVSLFMPLWVNHWYITQGLCPLNSDTESTGDIKRSCAKAYHDAAILTGIAQTCALVGAPVFGILADKLRGSGRSATALAGFIGVVGFLGFGFAPSPVSVSAYFFAALIGFGQIGMIVTSLVLITQANLARDISGFVAGVYSSFGTIGILLTTKLGGVLFDRWSQGGPFVVLGCLHGLILVWAFVVLFVYIGRKPPGDQSAWSSLPASAVSVTSAAAAPRTTVHQFQPTQTGG